MTNIEKMVEISKTEDIGDPYYYKELRIPTDATLETYLPVIMKKFPKKVKWSKITLHFNGKSNEEYIPYEHSDKKIIKDRRQFALENYGKFPVTYACSNIDYGEYYFDIWLNEIVKKEVKTNKKSATSKKTLKTKPTKPSKQNIKLDYSVMSKAELKKILESRNVRVYYHDTLAILREKCKNSEV